MGWQEKVAEDRERKIANDKIGWEKITDFWEKLKTANSALIPGAQLDLKNDSRELYCNRGYIVVAASINIHMLNVIGNDNDITIWYFPEINSLVASKSGSSQFYKIDEKSPAIIIKNVCQGIDPVQDLSINSEAGKLIKKIRNNKNGACFIVTAVYGNQNSIEVIALRNYRDKKLSKTFLGRVIIKIYYAISPFIANYIRDRNNIKNKFKPLLDFIVKHIK
jgi:hypothetical protein